MIVAIPSKSRAGATKSDLVIPSATMFVPEEELDTYRQHVSCDLVGVPERVRGITPTRNFILDYADGDDVVFVDDDVVLAGFRRMHDDRSEHVKLYGSEWTEEFLRLFDVTRSLGFRIFGVSNVSATHAVYPYKPFLFRTYVTASCMGILGDSGLRFDERFVVKEDYELCLRCVTEDGGVVGARYLYWENEHWKTPGGCSDYRTDEIEEAAIELLASMYPGYVRRKFTAQSPHTIRLAF